MDDSSNKEEVHYIKLSKKCWLCGVVLVWVQDTVCQWIVELPQQLAET